MYTRWTPEHTNFIKNNLKSSDEDIKKGLFDKFHFDVTMEAVKKKRQRLRLSKPTGRKKTTIEEKDAIVEDSKNRDI